jgi:queuine tRNA-ribosyltransferase
VKGVPPRDLKDLGATLVLSNTYHLYLRPGDDLIARLGGLHRFMGWDRAILTDSGGYQVLSLAELRRIGEDGVVFQSHLDGSRHVLTPEKVVDIQLALGVDILMALDECPPHDADAAYHQASMERTLRWAARCRAAHPSDEPALFGIVQGGTLPDLRARSADETRRIGFSGYALGGLGIGEGPTAMYATVEDTAALLPADAPRYLMGVGTPQDLLECIARGVDMFDCVLPTRNGRNGTLFTTGRISIKADPRSRRAPGRSRLRCYTCRHFSGLSAPLVRRGEILALRRPPSQCALLSDLMRQAARHRGRPVRRWKRRRWRIQRTPTSQHAQEIRS